MIIDGYDLARRVIERNREAVRLMADELLQVESLEADEIKAILDRAGATSV